MHFFFRLSHLSGSLLLPAGSGEWRLLFEVNPPLKFVWFCLPKFCFCFDLKESFNLSPVPKRLLFPSASSVSVVHDG